MTYKDLAIGTRFRRASAGERDFCLRVAGTEWPWLKQDEYFVEYMGRPIPGMDKTKQRWFDSNCDVEAKP